MIKNTSKNPNIEWLLGGSPNAIEAQEKEGQNQLVDSSFNEVSQLPKKGNGCDAIEIYESLGFKIIGESEGGITYLLMLYFQRAGLLNQQDTLCGVIL